MSVEALLMIAVGVAVGCAVSALIVVVVVRRRESQQAESVTGLTSVAGVEASNGDAERAAERRITEYARLMGSVASASAARLEEVRLPLHILLENRFGDLNENQEEMLGAARNAAEAVDADILALRQIAELDLGKRELRDDRILPGDLLRALVPTLQASAEKANATLHVDIEPAVPAIHGDPPAMHDALASLLGDAIRSAAEGSALNLALVRDKTGATVRLTGASNRDATPRLLLAERMLAAMGAEVMWKANELTIAFGR